MSYTGSDPALEDLQAQITALTARVNVIDGQTLADPAQGVLNQHLLKINGLKTDLKQSVLALQSILNSYIKQLAEFLTTVKTHLGV